MLVLGLKPHEAIHLGSQIVLRFFYIDGKPKIGIEAPRDIGVSRHGDEPVKTAAVVDRRRNTHKPRGEK